MRSALPERFDLRRAAARQAATWLRCMAVLLLSCNTVLAQSAPVCTTQTVGNRDFYGISGSSDSYVIGVGDQGSIYQYNGTSWSAMSSPTSEELFDVEVVSPGVAFAVGDNGTVLQLSGTSWIDRSGFTNRDMFGVWAASANEAYAVGDRGEIWRWNGSSWSDQSSAAGTDNRDIEDVWGNAGFVYAMSERGELYIYNRSTGNWLSREDACRQGNNFTDVWGDAAGNIYMSRREDIYRYNGGSCSVVATASDRMNGLYGGSDGQVYAGGRSGVVLHFDGSNWVESTEANQEINDVWVSPSGSVYYGGDQGEITSCVQVQPNVIGDWPMDDCTLGFNGSAVNDVGPNGIDGTTVGGVAVEANGQMCSAAGLNGSTSYVRVPDTAVLDVQNGLSFAVWVRHNGGLSDWQAVFAKGDSSYRLHLNGGCTIADTLPGNTRYGFTFGMNGGCANADLNSNVVPSPGVWYHVAGTYDRNVMRIYINGSLVNTANNNSAINTNNYDLFIGENSQQRNRYWNGDIDELTMWDNAISAQEIVNHMNRTRPCTGCSSVEFTINHDNNGIHCLDETIVVNVIDSLTAAPRLDYSEQVTLDTQTGSGTWTLVSGSGALVDGTANDGIATYQWPLNEDSAEFALTYPQGTAVFDIDVYQSTDSAIRDNDAEGPMTFGPSGFTVTAAPLSNPPPGVIVPFSATQVAATDFNVYLAAFGQTPNDPVCGVIESYDGARDLQVWNDYVNPGTGSVAPLVDGIAVASSEAAAGTQSVAFSNGQAVVTGRYKDVGALRLNFKDDNVADPNLPNGIRGATAAFVSQPFSFVLGNIEDSVGNPNPAAADAGGTAFIAAGRPFSITVSALDADGDPTPNYGRETVPETVALATTLVSPVAGNAPAVNFATGFGAFVAGQATGNDFSWPETGVMRLTPFVGDGSYLGTGNVTGVSSVNIGRFYPDHFTAVQNAPAFGTSCTAGSFTYLGEAFAYTSNPVITFTARATDGSVTQNYSGAYFRVDNTTLANRSYSAATGTLDTSGLPAATGDPTVADLGGGVGTLTFSSGSGLAFVKGTPVAPFAADISLAIDLIDGDGVATLANPVTFSSIAFNAGNEMRYGRVRLLNQIGSELVNLNVPMRSEYFSDASTGFVQNADDSCSTAIELGFSGFTENLTALETCVIENGAPGASNVGCSAPGPAGLRYREPPLSGDFNLYLAAPGSGKNGSVAITADVPAWLRFDWDAASPGLENPVGTATFGIYRGEDRRIYTREIY